MRGGSESTGRLRRCLCRCRAVATFVFSHIGLMSLVVGYTLIGAFTFEALEADFEREKKRQMRAARNDVVTGLWELTASDDFERVLYDSNWTYRVSEHLRDFERDLVLAVRKGGYDGNDDELQWTFSGAMLYSIIVITSIGYGNVAPKTPGGKVVTILYAVFGIPLMLLCMSNIGDTLAHSFKFVYWKVCCFLCTRTAARRRARRRAQQHQLNAHNRRLRRYPSMRRTASARVSSSHRSSGHRSSSHRSSGHRSSRHSGGSAYGGRYEQDDRSSGGSTGYYATQIQSPTTCDDETVDTEIRGRLPINVQPNRSCNHKDDGPSTHSTITGELSKEDMRVDLPPLMSPSAPGTPKIDGCLRNNLRAQRSVSVEPQLMRHQHQGSGHRRPQFQDNQRQYQHQHSLDRDYDFYDEHDEDVDDYSMDDDVDSDREHVTVPIWLCCALVTGYICGGALLFSVWEGWNFLDSSYFCFVTLTTIGFGDLVPGKTVIHDDSQTTLAICALYLLFGMALLAMSFNLVQEQVTTCMREIGQRIGIIEDDDTDDE